MFVILRPPAPRSTLFPYTTLFRSGGEVNARAVSITGQVVGPPVERAVGIAPHAFECQEDVATLPAPVQAVEVRVERMPGDRKSTRLNSSHITTSYAVFCLKKTKTS